MNVGECLSTPKDWKSVVVRPGRHFPVLAFVIQYCGFNPSPQLSYGSFSTTPVCVSIVVSRIEGTVRLLSLWVSTYADLSTSLTPDRCGRRKGPCGTTVPPPICQDHPPISEAITSTPRSSKNQKSLNPHLREGIHEKGEGSLNCFDNFHSHGCSCTFLRVVVIGNPFVFRFGVLSMSCGLSHRC